MPYKDIEKRREANRRYNRKWRKANPGYHSAYTKAHPEANRAAHKKWKEANRAQYNANRTVARRVERNRWPSPVIFKCTDCEAPAAHYHHEDYTMWWSVEPLCLRCHGVRHRKP